jgi:2-polyprenyl-6-methoxyphenol hydroxylase-like FAD-dependent oxidoreductase
MENASSMDILVAGGGIGGLTAALWLHRIGIRCRVYEASRHYNRLGVGINLQPHAVKELSELRLEAALVHRGVVIEERAFFNAHGQLIYREPVGRFAGLPFPHVTIQRADLHDILLAAVIERLGPDAIVMGHRCTGIEQDGNVVIAQFANAGSGHAQVVVKADMAVACDGLQSAIRRRFYPHEPAPLYCGKTSWRGLAHAEPFLSGATVAFVGAYNTGMFAAYPVKTHPDGTQLINLIACLPKQVPVGSDFDRQARLGDFIDRFNGWIFDWIDVPRLFSSTKDVLEFPLVDRDPIPRWTFGRVTLLGDAAHPMSPRGGNGAAQAIIDAATLARCLAGEPNPDIALDTYEARRRPATSDIVMANRQNPPDTIIERVERRTGGSRFDVADHIATCDELRVISQNYQRVTGALGA